MVTDSNIQMQRHYNMVNFLWNPHNRHLPHCSPVRERYGVPVVILKSYSLPATVIAVWYVISWWIGPHYNATWLYIIPGWIICLLFLPSYFRVWILKNTVIIIGVGEVKPWQQEVGKCQDTTIRYHMKVPFVVVKLKIASDDNSKKNSNNFLQFVFGNVLTTICL